MPPPTKTRPLPQVPALSRLPQTHRQSHQLPTRQLQASRPSSSIALRHQAPSQPRLAWTAPITPISSPISIGNLGPLKKQRAPAFAAMTKEPLSCPSQLRPNPALLSRRLRLTEKL